MQILEFIDDVIHYDQTYALHESASDAFGELRSYYQQGISQRNYVRFAKAHSRLRGEMGFEAYLDEVIPYTASMAKRGAADDLIKAKAGTVAIGLHAITSDIFKSYFDPVYLSDDEESKQLWEGLVAEFVEALKQGAREKSREPIKQMVASLGDRNLLTRTNVTGMEVMLDDINTTSEDLILNAIAGINSGKYGNITLQRWLMTSRFRKIEDLREATFEGLGIEHTSMKGSGMDYFQRPVFDQMKVQKLVTENLKKALRT
jgi:hypothetical protein